MTQIYYLPDEKLIEIESSEVILEASLRSEIPHTHICGGNARCSTCRVMILEGLEYCAPRNAAEQVLTEKMHFDPSIRLACQTQVIGDGTVTLRRLALDAEDVALISDELTGKMVLGSIGQEKEIAILFADIRGFTRFSEMLLPYDVIYLLNRYFHQMGMVINRHGGIINNYMGDGLMALFGVEPLEQPADRAVRAALDMLAEMEQLNPYIELLYHQRLEIGIGIHYGSAVIGSVGASNNRMMTAIGDAVNFASRIESANKQLGTHILISEETYQRVQNSVTIGKTSDLTIPGKSGKYCLYEVVDMTGALPDLLYAAPKPRRKRSLRVWLRLIWREMVEFFSQPL